MNRMRGWVVAFALGLPGVALGQYQTQAVTSPGAIAGRVSYAGSAPSLPAEQRDKNPEVCGSNRPSESLEVDASGGLANVVVYLEDIHAGKPLQPVEANLNQVGCTYVPHVQAVPVGSTLNLLNGDPILHNIHATQGASTAFNYAMPGSVRKIPKKLSRAGFLAIKCDVHGWMNGTVAVMENPYFGVTDASGNFTIGDIPPGTYKLTTWQERLGKTSQSVTVRAGETVKPKLSLTGS